MTFSGQPTINKLLIQLEMPSQLPQCYIFYFDASKPTRLSTDASCHGLGFIRQHNIVGMWNLIQAGSRFLTDTES